MDWWPGKKGMVLVARKEVDGLVATKRTGWFSGQEKLDGLVGQYRTEWFWWLGKTGWFGWQGKNWMVLVARKEVKELDCLGD